jgi:hypothetical protein
VVVTTWSRVLETILLTERKEDVTSSEIASVLVLYSAVEVLYSIVEVLYSAVEVLYSAAGMYSVEVLYSGTVLIKVLYSGVVLTVEAEVLYSVVVLTVLTTDGLEVTEMYSSTLIPLS